MSDLILALQKTIQAFSSRALGRARALGKLLQTPTDLGLLVADPRGRLLALPAPNGWTLPVSRTAINSSNSEEVLAEAKKITGAELRSLRRVGRHEDPRGNVDWWYGEATSNSARSQYSWVERQRLHPEGPSGRGADELLASYRRLVLESDAPRLPEARAIVGGCEVAYTDTITGQGPPLVLLHGLGSDRQVFRWNLPAWSRERRIIALDLPGHGESDKPAMSYSMRLFAEVVRRFLDQAGVGEFDLLGYSMGGAVACQLAALAPQRVRKLALLAPAGLQGELRQSKRLRSIARLMRNPFYPAIRDPLFKRRFAGFYRRFTAEVDVLFQETLELSQTHDFEQRMLAVADCIDSLLDFPARSIYPKIEAPTLILFGEDDAIIPFEQGYSMQRAIADARMRLLPDCGHLLVVEARDQVNQHLLDFLEEHREQPELALQAGA